MKKILYLFCAFFVLGLYIHAEDALLIDFSLLTPDYPADNPTLHERTILDYSIAAGTNYTAEQKAEMKTSLALTDWVVKLNSSADSLFADSVSYVRPAVVNDNSPFYPGDTVLGIRTSFPTEPYNAYITIRPPFKILAYADRDELQPDGSLVVPAEEEGAGRKFDSLGVVKNVGLLRSVAVSTYGLNYPHKLTVLIEDIDRKIHEIPLGHMEFEGWQELEWMNPNYIEDVKKRDLRVRPLYPTLSPYIRFVGIRIYRNGIQVGGDFIGYIKDIQVTYDKAREQFEENIDNERVWGILRERSEERRQAELQGVGRLELLRYIERLKKHVVQDLEGVE